MIDWDESHVDVADLDLALPGNAAGLDLVAFDVAAQAQAAWEGRCARTPLAWTTSRPAQAEHRETGEEDQHQGDVAEEGKGALHQAQVVLGGLGAEHPLAEGGELIEDLAVVGERAHVQQVGTRRLARGRTSDQFGSWRSNTRTATLAGSSHETWTAVRPAAPAVSPHDVPNSRSWRWAMAS